MTFLLFLAGLFVLERILRYEPRRKVYPAPVRRPEAVSIEPNPSPELATQGMLSLSDAIQQYQPEAPVLESIHESTSTKKPV